MSMIGQPPAQAATGAALGRIDGDYISQKVKGRAWNLRRRDSIRRYQTLIPELEQANRSRKFQLIPKGLSNYYHLKQI